MPTTDVELYRYVNLPSKTRIFYVPARMLDKCKVLRVCLKPKII